MPDDTITAVGPDDVEQVAWDLSPLVDGEEAAGALRLLDEAEARARAFADAYAGKVAGLDSAGLRDAMLELGAIEELAGRAGTYAMLRFAVDTADPETGALLQRVQERGTTIETTLLFFDLEWAALDDERAEELLAGDGLDFCRHHLRNLRRYRPHLLSEPEEKVLTEKAITGRGAWSRLFAEVTSAIEVTIEGEATPVPLDAALARLVSPDRDERRRVADAVTAALDPGLRTRGFVLNTLLHDKAVDDRLRSYPHWLASRNLSNEASDESVEALVRAVRARFDIPQRWYRLKAQLLGVDRLADYDRAAAVTAEEPSVAWPDARALVLDSYTDFDARVGELVTRFFAERWIDAPVRPNKRGGAFCAYAVPSVHPYVMLNFTAKRRDVLILAHELGHGVHAALAAPQGVFHQHTPLTLSETASVFGETIVFGRLLERADSPESRLALLAESLEGSIATVFRQVAMNRFEDLAHTARRGEGELSVERIGELWAESQEEMFGDAVEVTDGYRSWWSYVPHFISTPGYVYAYAYGQLLALSVYRRYREEGEGFVDRYVEMLSAGGSKSPEELAEIVGVDLNDPGFWDAGLDLVAEQLESAEAAAREAGRVPA
ncbi:MAG TPA: M3 family oligoendopeptidase [Solirubrobacteraceae bacterium]|nr:M3 family oligoendopeptidase [Solirubrobacteraceae bacterium]